MAITLRQPMWGGLVARAGWAWGPRGENGPTWSIGLVAGTLPSIAITVGTLLIATLFAAALDGVGDGIGDVLGGG